jgi:hypothetical protein
VAITPQSFLSKLNADKLKGAKVKSETADAVAPTWSVLSESYLEKDWEAAEGDDGKLRE